MKSKSTKKRSSLVFLVGSKVDDEELSRVIQASWLRAAAEVAEKEDRHLTKVEFIQHLLRRIFGLEHKVYYL